MWRQCVGRGGVSRVGRVAGPRDPRRRSRRAVHRGVTEIPRLRGDDGHAEDEPVKQPVQEPDEQPDGQPDRVTNGQPDDQPDRVTDVEPDEQPDNQPGGGCARPASGSCAAASRFLRLVAHSPAQPPPRPPSQRRAASPPAAPAAAAATIAAADGIAAPKRNSN